MQKFTQNERGFSLLSVLAAVLIIGIIATISVPAIFGGPGATEQAPVEQAEQVAPEVSSTLIIKAAEYADATNGGELDSYSIGELVESGFLSDSFTEEQKRTRVAKTGEGHFAYLP